MGSLGVVEALWSIGSYESDWNWWEYWEQETTSHQRSSFAADSEQITATTTLITEYIEKILVVKSPPGF